LTKIVDLSDAIPGGRGSTALFKVVCCPRAVGARGDVIFSGANTYGGTLPVGVGIEGIYRWSSSSSGGAITAIVDTRTSGLAHISHGSRTVAGDHILFFSNAPRGLYLVNSSAQSGNTGNVPPLQLVGARTPVPAAASDEGDQLDDGREGGDRGFFRAFGSPISGGGDFGAFIGSSTTGVVGVYLLDLTGHLVPPVFHVVRSIADSTTPIPGLPPSVAGDVFAEFPIDPSVSGSHVIFFARAGNQSNTGLYLWGPSTDYSPRAVVTLGETGLFDLTIQPNSFSGACLTYFGSDGEGNATLYAVDPFEAAEVAKV
jgi:hypothetical protein